MALSLFPFIQLSPYCAAMSMNFPRVYAIFFLLVSSFLSSMSITPSICIMNISSRSGFPSKASTSVSLVDISGDGIRLGVGGIGVGELDLEDVVE
jgi:hypothetical protein